MALSETAPAPPPALTAPTMCEALMTTAALRPDQVALRSPDDSFSLTFAQLLRRLAATASLLHDRGLRKGDALGLMMLNRPEFHVVDAAAMLLGATPFSLYNTSPAEQIAFVMGDAGNRIVVAEARFVDVVRQAAGDGVQVVELGELEGGDEDFDLEPHWRAVAPEDLLTLIYTSGTTGPPKGVELTHANMLAELRAMHAAVPLEGGGRWVSFLPSAHVADRWGSHYASLMTYGHTVTPVADPTQLFAVVAQVRPTAFGGVPRVWEKLKAALEASGAAALPQDQLRARLGLHEARWLAVCKPRFADVLREAAGDAVRVVELDELSGGDEGFDLESRWRAVTPDDLLTLIYTSGTTGPPKGVELAHASMLAELRGVHAAVPLEGGGRWVSFLPSAHVADRWGSHYSALMTYGHTVTPVADPTQVFAVVAQVRPTSFGGVPRVWEKLKAALEASGAAALPADQLKARLGLDEARWLAVGAAPTPVEVLEFFAERGMPICEVWGMSETSCIVTTNRPGATKLGSVGQPVDGMELWIADDGELLVRGPLVMAGYRNRPDLTAQAVDADGWLHTGDVGRIDDDGYVWIVDRKKELIINAAGKNISPANIEALLKSSGPLIGQACVIGDRRPYIVALLVLDPDTAAGLDPTDADVVAQVQEEVDAANAHLARVEQVKRFRVVPAEWLPGGDELTPTMKLKRRPIAEKYAGEIDALYA